MDRHEFRDYRGYDCLVDREPRRLAVMSPEGHVQDLRLDGNANVILIHELLRLAARVKELEEALDTIKGGHTDRFPGAPDATTWTGSPSDFRSAMWTWSQSVAKNALEQSGEGL